MTDSAVKIKVLVLWCDNKAANYGLRVLAKGNEELIRRAFPNAVIEVDFQDFGPGDSLVSFGTRSILKDIFRVNGPIKEKLRGYDLILDSGAGDSFADIYGLKRLSFIAYAHSVIRKLSLPLVLAPQTIGPFKTKIGRAVARRTIRYASLVLTRDSRSSEYSESLGRRPDLTATDVVFALPQEPQRQFPSVGIAVNVSGLLWFADDHVHSGSYRDATKELVTSLVLSGRAVSLLAHVVHSPNGNDDVDAANELVEELSAENGIELEVIVPQDLTEARDVLAAADLVVGARMHACLNALSMGTPAIPWAYSRKFAPLMNDLGWNLTIDLNEDRTPAATTIAMITETDWSEKSTQLHAARGRANAALDQAARSIGLALTELMADV